LLLVIDSLIVLFMGGAFSRMPKRAPAAAASILALAVALAAVAPSGQALAQSSDAKPGDEQILERLDNTHLAYVITGEAEVDRLSEQGLAGLTD
ncbi:hypothetical protein, partial [Salmonella sp. s29873]